MLFKRVLNSFLILVLVFIIAYPLQSYADRIVLERSTVFGRIKAITDSSVVIATGCSGDVTQTIKWDDIDKFGGIVFDNECDAKWHASTSGATADGVGPTSQWYFVSFSDTDKSFLWAESVSLGSDGVLKLKLAKGKGSIHGPITDVYQLSRNIVYTDKIDASSFKWPKTYVID